MFEKESKFLSNYKPISNFIVAVINLIIKTFVLTRCEQNKLELLGHFFNMDSQAFDISITQFIQKIVEPLTFPLYQFSN